MTDATAGADGHGALLGKLQELGMSATGARQLLDAQALDAPEDRRLLADLVGQMLAPPTLSAMSGDALATSTEPGTSKVSARIIAENFD